MFKDQFPISNQNCITESSLKPAIKKKKMLSNILAIVFNIRFLLVIQYLTKCDEISSMLAKFTVHKQE